MNTIKIGADYITSCYVSDEQFVVQVGNSVRDSADQHSPEYMTQPRPVYFVNATYPGEELTLPYSLVRSITYCTWQQCLQV